MRLELRISPRWLSPAEPADYRWVTVSHWGSSSSSLSSTNFRKSDVSDNIFDELHSYFHPVVVLKFNHKHMCSSIYSQFCLRRFRKPDKIQCPHIEHSTNRWTQKEGGCDWALIKRRNIQSCCNVTAFLLRKQRSAAGTQNPVHINTPVSDKLLGSPKMLSVKQQNSCLSSWKLVWHLDGNNWSLVSIF